MPSGYRSRVSASLPALRYAHHPNQAAHGWRLRSAVAWVEQQVAVAGGRDNRHRTIEVGRHEGVAVRVGRIDRQADLCDLEVDRLNGVRKGVAMLDQHRGPGGRRRPPPEIRENCSSHAEPHVETGSIG